MDENIIRKVREHEVLYNNGLPGYRDQNIRHAAWEKIGNELQVTASEAKARWEKLRRCFGNARNRRRTRTGREHSWKYEQQMSFILPFFENRKSHGDSNKSEISVGMKSESGDLSEEPEPEETTTPSQSQHIDLETEIKRNIQEKPSEDDGAAFSNVKIYEERSEADEASRIKKQKKQIVQTLEEKSPMEEYEEENIRLQAPRTTILETLDETDMFFLSMSRMTKKLPKVEQAKIKLALSTSVLSAEVRCNQQ